MRIASDPLGGGPGGEPAGRRVHAALPAGRALGGRLAVRGRVGELSVEHVDPRRAICEAILKLRELPNWERLFGRKSRDREAR